MRAVIVDRWMEPDELTVREVPDPELRPGSLDVEVRSAGCNFYDSLIVRGRYQTKPAFPFTPGGEVAGVVRRVGDGVEGFAEGDRVLAAPMIGGFAERILLDADRTWVLPDAMSFDEGAALPITYPTSYAALVFRADLSEGETLLVHAAAGGVGLAAVQIGRALGARVIATAGGADKCQVALDAGAHEAIDYRADDFVPRVKALTDGRGADVIYDPVGGETTDESLRCIAWNGRLLIVGFASGTIPQIAANRVMLKNVSVVGVHWGAYETHQPEAVPAVFDALFLLHAEGRIAPLIYGTFPLEEVPKAIAALTSRKTHGKVIVRP
jgi:NADPH2:quinone reductase